MLANREFFDCYWQLSLLSLFIVGLTWSQVCVAQEVSIAVIYSGNAQPVLQKPVDITFSDSQMKPIAQVKAQTQNDGTTTLQPPIEARFISVSAFDEGLITCSPSTMLRIPAIVNSGLAPHDETAVPARCKYSKQVKDVVPKPGRLVIVVRRLTWWERFLSHFWE